MHDDAIATARPRSASGACKLLYAALGLVVLATLRRFYNAPVWDDEHLLQLARSALARGDLLGLFTHSTLGQVVERAGDANAGDLDLYRPMVLLSLVTDYTLGGGALAIFHATNLALHLACIAVVYVLARELLAPEQRRYAPLAAAWFGVTPHLAEAHVWISGRFDELSTLFGLVAIVLWRRSLRATTRRTRLLEQCACGVVFLLGLLSKEPLAFALPALAFWPARVEDHGPSEHTLGPPPLAARLLTLAPFVGAVLAYVALRVHVLHGAGAGVSAATLVASLARFPLLVCDAAWNLVLPNHVYSRLLKEDYDALGPAVMVLAAAACVLVATLAYRARKRAPVFAWSLLWLGSTLAPIAVIATRSWPGFGRFLYLPATFFFIGLAELVALLIATQPRVTRMVHVALVCHVLVLAVRLHLYTGDFANDDVFFGSIIAEAPDRSHGYAFLGMTYLERHRYADAAVLLEKAQALAPFERRYVQTLGQALLFSGQRSEALSLANESIAHLGNAPEMELLAAYAMLDDPPHVALRVLACLDQAPNNKECSDALAFLTTRHAQAPAFRSAFERACSSAPAQRRPGCNALRALSRPGPSAVSPAQ